MPSFAKLTALDAQDPRPFELGKIVSKSGPRTEKEQAELRARDRLAAFETGCYDLPSKEAAAKIMGDAYEAVMNDIRGMKVQVGAGRSNGICSGSYARAMDVLTGRFPSAAAEKLNYAPPATISRTQAARMANALGCLIDDLSEKNEVRKERFEIARAAGLQCIADARDNPTAALEVMYQILGSREKVIQFEPSAVYERGTKFRVLEITQPRAKPSPLSKFPS